jgi:hypothetical protein
MGKPTKRGRATRDGHARGQSVSKLGREIQKLRDAYVASGVKLLNRRELEHEIAERRGLR